MKNEKFLVCATLFLAFTIPLIIFNGSIDDFVPKLITGIFEVSQRGHLSLEQENSVPGYFVLGSILAIICGFSAKNLVFLPIQLIPFTFIFFLFLYTFSKNYILSASLTLIEMISGISGSLKVFFWPHGIGFILFYIAIFILSKLVDNKRKISEFRLLLIIIGSSLVFISYDLFTMFILFIGAVSLIFLVVYLYSKIYNSSKAEYFSYSLNFFNLLLIVFVVELGFSRFFYNNILPTVLNTNYVEISSIDKFISSYISKNYFDFPLSNFLVDYPMSISILSAIKYSLLLISILFFTFIIFKKITARDTLDFSSVGIFSILVASVFYAFLRLHIGQVFITYIYLPGILSASWLYQYSPVYRKGVTCLILFLLVICPINYYEISTHNLMNKDPNKFETLEEPSFWCFYHQGPNKIASDILTQGISNYYYTEKQIDAEKNSSFLNNHKLNLLTTDNALLILNRSDSSETYGNFLINYDLNTMNLNNWVIIKSWKPSRNIIENNPRLNKIYDLNSVAVFQN